MDKFPELEGNHNGELSGDLLSREKELLGEDNDFSSQPVPEEDVEIDESAQFEANFPPVSTADNSEQISQVPTPSEPSTPTNEESKPKSAFLEEWKVKQELALERRDKASADKQEQIREKAKAAIDDFYSNYNQKREESVAKVREDAEKFIAERDEQNSGSTWQKVSALISDIGKPAEGVTPADKSRFKEIVESLKNDPDAPGLSLIHI